MRTSDVIGWFGAAAATMILTAIVGWFTGSFESVATYASDPERLCHLVLWSIAFLLAGFAVGIVIRHISAVRRLKRENKEHEEKIAKLNEKIHELEYGGMTPEKAAKIIPNLSVDELSAVGWLLQWYGDGLSDVLSSHILSAFEMLVVKGVALKAGDSVFSLAPGTTEAIRGSEELLGLVKDAMLHVNYDERGNRHEVPRQVREKVMSETQSN